MKKLSLLVLIAVAFVLAIGAQANAEQADPVGSSSTRVEGIPSGSLVIVPELATEQPPGLMDPGLELIVDSDGDGVLDPFDNCPDVANPEEEIWPADGWGPPELKQPDADDDGIGDACEDVPEMGDPLADTDGDGVSDDLDNCPDDPNTDQADEDGDGVGDFCDVCLDDPDPLHQDLNDCVVDEDEVEGEVDEVEESGDSDEMNYYDLSEDEFDDAMDSNMEMSGGCSMVPAATANPLIFLLISAAFIPVVIRRKE